MAASGGNEYLAHCRIENGPALKGPDEGEIMHRDSVDSEQPIRPGEVNWMTAGRGITHSERFERGRQEGGPLNGLQAWVALPSEHEETAPEFRHYGTEHLPCSHEAGVWTRLIAGAITPTVVMLLGGEPVGERFIEWNFVSTSKARIEEAKADWRAGRMKLPDRDNAEFIPLPGDPLTDANPMS